MSIASAISNLLGGGSENGSYDILSYQTVLKDLQNWKQSGGVYSSEFNELDTPSTKYFRIMFHFFNSDESLSDDGGYGLLHPTWQKVNKNSKNSSLSAAEASLTQSASSKSLTENSFEKPTGDDITNNNFWERAEVSGRAQELSWWKYSTAYSYLMMNNEFERAQYCKSFIELLSNISTYSPWYFQSVNGLNEAVNRTSISEGGDFEIKERGKISINCLEDAVDNRIGTLLDLYRAMTWSWRTKRFIIPANLRKFDMTIAVIEAPIKTLHHPKGNIKLTDALGQVGEWLSTEDDDFATANISDTSHYLTSYKMYELHNCEIDYNSSQTGVETVDNENGWQPKYKIDISFDDCEEYSYNEFLQGVSEFGDFVKSDSLLTQYTDPNHLETHTKTYPNPVPSDTYASHMLSGQDKELENRLDVSSGLFSQLEGVLFNWTSNKVDSAILGNLFGLSVTRLAEDVSQLLTGDYTGTATRIASGVNNYNGSHTTNGDPIRNITEDDAKKLSSMDRAQSLGNIFASSTTIRSSL